MAEVKVWSPAAASVELDLNGERVSLESGSRGWWSIDEPRLKHGVDYAFVVDGDGPFPDPRSLWQPNGVHGASRWFDHSVYQWRDQSWQAPPLASGIVYELHLGTFTREGTYRAAKEKLDHLVDLGINYVELMPVVQFDGRWGWGYDGVDLYAPFNGYGDPNELKDFVDSCHAKGLAVMLDVVYNHLGPSGNYIERFGPYFTQRYETSWGRAVNLDGRGSDEVRGFFIDNALMWLRDYHFDGLRIDAVHAFLDTSATHFLEELTAAVRNLGNHLRRHYVIIAESDLNDPRIVRRPEIGGYGLDAQWNEDFHHALHPLLTGEQFGYFIDFGSVSDLAKVLGHGQVYNGQYSKFRDRRHGREPAGLNGHRFVGCLQNHDQIGNRGAGERINHLITLSQLKLGAAVALLSPFTPLIFQGEEWAASSPFAYFTDFTDEELSEAVRAGRKREFSAFGWNPDSIADPQAESTFQGSKLDWAEIERRPHREALDWYKALIRLRRSWADFTDGKLDPDFVRFDEDEKWLTFRRGRFLVACNFGTEARRIAVGQGEQLELEMASSANVAVDGQERFLHLPAETVGVCRLAEELGELTGG